MFFEFQWSCQPAQPFLTTSPSISLTQLIGAGKLTDKMKLLLSHLLARTLWQYYKPDWMPEDWSKESVHFMFDEHDGRSKVITINKPFLQARFNRTEQCDQAKIAPVNATDEREKKCHKKRSVLQEKLRTHSYPKVLALGVMLLEVELDKKIEDFRGSECHDLDKINVLRSVAAEGLKNKISGVLKVSTGQ